ncbi:hypothetical protein GH714_044143 [Hevea brasiliensis]|uniref:DNA-directed DNA polymerase family A palm domain-containing protein n=1 Tax=Hevea brasiliensis TaxID=3981 RepID=A0A6A6K4I5_HEVBR|nr:hypothetical protein GH714_044143 [Hevea brasiliensis]
MTMEYLFLDTETYSAADLKKVGSYAYAEHPSTEVLICSYAVDDEPVQVWDCTDGSRMPEDLRKALRLQRHKAKLVMANGLLFDRLIMRNVWDIEIDPRDILDTMVLAFRHSLPGSLEAQCEVLQVQEDNAKDKKGKALIQRFCKPTPKNYKVRRYDQHAPAGWADFIRYAKSDISAMREYGGAKRTLRWAGRGFQPQNLARGYFSGEELEQGIDMLLKGRAHWLYDVSKLTASTVRGCIIPTEGNKLVVADYSNVEGRGLAWAAGEETALATFEAGLDIYCVTAGKMFGLEPDFIKQNRKELRQIGKACELGLGYGGGVAAFLTFAKNLGLDLYAMARR